MSFPCGSAPKESTCNAGDLGLNPGLGRSPGEGKSYPLQYSGLENFMDCMVYGVIKSKTQLRDFHRIINGRVGIWTQVFLTDDAVKVLHSIYQKIWKTQQWPQDGKRSVLIPVAKKDNSKECSNYRTIALISHASKVMLKILQARLQQYVNRELPDIQAGFRKGWGTRDQIANIHWLMEKARKFHKNTYFCFIDYAKAFNCVDHNKL